MNAQEARKQVDQNIASCVCLLKNELDKAIEQAVKKSSCIVYTPDFLSKDLEQMLQNELVILEVVNYFRGLGYIVTDSTNIYSTRYLVIKW